MGDEFCGRLGLVIMDVFFGDDDDQAFLKEVFKDIVGRSAVDVGLFCDC